MVRRSKYADAAGCRSIRGQKQIHFRSSKNLSFSGAGKFLYALMLLVFIGAIIYSIFFSQFLAVAEIEVSGTENLNPAEIRKIAEDEISGNFLGFIPRNNILLAGKKTIEKNILEKYKYAEKVEIKKDFPDSINIAVKERKFNLILCGSGKCYIIDNRGAAFMEADFSSYELGEDKLAVLYDGGNKNFSQGEVIFERDYMDYFLGIREKMKNELGIEIGRELLTPQIASGDIRAKTVEGWQIYFDKSIPLNKEISMLKIVLENKIDPNRRVELEYIDLRTENKVYYKFKNSEKQATDQPAPEEKKN